MGSSLVGFYQELFGLMLGSDWAVASVDADIGSHRIEVRIGYRGPGPIYDHTEERRWRHLDTCQCETYLICEVPRRMTEHGVVETLPVPWADAYQRMTMYLESQVIWVLSEVRDRRLAARLLQITEGVITHVYERATARAHARQTADSDRPVIRYVGIDEKRYAHPRQMATIVVDLERGHVLAAQPGRTSRTPCSSILAILTSTHYLNRMTI